MINVDEYTEVKNLFDLEDYTGEMKPVQIDKKHKNEKINFRSSFLRKNLCCCCMRKTKKLPKIEIPMEAFNV